jgi:hypothetical protein
MVVEVEFRDGKRVWFRKFMIVFSTEIHDISGDLSRELDLIKKATQYALSSGGLLVVLKSSIARLTWRSTGGI